MSVSTRRAVVQGDGPYYLRDDDPRREGTHPPGTVDWAEHSEAWGAYAKRYGREQDADRIHARGGFSYLELADLLGRSPATWKSRER